jgi:hypothetical protein
MSASTQDMFPSGDVPIPSGLRQFVRSRCPSAFTVVDNRSEVEGNENLALANLADLDGELAFTVRRSDLYVVSILKEDHTSALGVPRLLHIAFSVP